MSSETILGLILTNKVAMKIAVKIEDLMMMME